MLNLSDTASVRLLGELFMQIEKPRVLPSVFSSYLVRRVALASLCAAVLPALAGCQPGSTTVDNGYGRMTGAGFRTSVNGTRVFADMLESYGREVDKYTRLTPRIDRYDTIVFFPQDREAPSQETVDRIENWLVDGWDRTFVFVGRDFDAEIEYWRAMLDNPDGSIRAHARRRLARAMANQDQARSSGNESQNPWVGSSQPTRDHCDWFQQSPFRDQTGTSLEGPLAKGIDMKESQIPYHTLLSPNSNWPGETYQVLTVDGKVFAFTIRRNEWNDGKIIVISNAAFLLNYPLINKQNRVMAGNLIDQLPFSNQVLFLESESDVPVSDTDYENHNRWAWITKPPIKYIIPQFLFWGILFCFVFFPIFGRPRRDQKKSPTNFKHHVSAMGRLLVRTKSPTLMLQWIQDYRMRSSKTRNRRQKS